MNVYFLFSIFPVFFAIIIIFLRQSISPALNIDSIIQNSTIKTEFPPIVVITGGCSGIGYSTAKYFSKLGYSIVLGCRDPSVLDKTCKTLMNHNPSTACLGLPLNLASFRSVKNFVQKLKSKLLTGPNPQALSILINNAGVRDDSFILTEDGIESHYQINHLSHYLLTRLLLPFLTASHSSSPDHHVQTQLPRIIHVSSSAHTFGIISPDQYNSTSLNRNTSLFHDSQLNRLEGVYGDTKLMNILFSDEINNRYFPQVLSLSVHPGFVSTNMGRDDKRWIQTLVLLTRPFLSRSSDQAALNLVWAGLESIEMMKNELFMLKEREIQKILTNQRTTKIKEEEEESTESSLSSLSSILNNIFSFFPSSTSSSSSSSSSSSFSQYKNTLEELSHLLISPSSSNSHSSSNPSSSTSSIPSSLSLYVDNTHLSLPHLPLHHRELREWLWNTSEEIVETYL